MGAQLLGPADWEPLLLALAAQVQDDPRRRGRRPAGHPAPHDSMPPLSRGGGWRRRRLR